MIDKFIQFLKSKQFNIRNGYCIYTYDINNKKIIRLIPNSLEKNIDEVLDYFDSFAVVYKYKFLNNDEEDIEFYDDGVRFIIGHEFEILTEKNIFKEFIENEL